MTLHLSDLENSDFRVPNVPVIGVTWLVIDINAQDDSAYFK